MSSQPTYRYGVGPANGAAATHALTTHSGRVQTYRIDGPPTVKLRFDGRSVDAGQFTPQATDLWVYRTRLDGSPADLMCRCRGWGENDDITETEHTFDVNAVGYRGLLSSSRFVGSSGRYFAPGTDQAVIAWTLISESQALTGGNWGITNGIGSSSATTRELTVKPKASIGEEIGKLGRLANGFEWEIDGNLAFNRWYPERGTDNGISLDFRGLVSRVKRTFDPNDNGNVATVTGGEGLTPVTTASATVGTDPRGRIEIVEPLPSVTEQATLNSRSPQLLADIEILRPEFVVTLKQIDTGPDGKPAGRSVWEGPGHIWLGDTVQLAVKSTPRVNIADAYRVMEIQIADGVNGDEVVQIGLVSVA